MLCADLHEEESSGLYASCAVRPQTDSMPMEEIIFNETTTIGIRRYKVERTILKRHEAKAKTAYGEVELKICEKNGIVYRYPEYESVKKLCEAAGVPFKVVYQAACEAEISE